MRGANSTEIQHQNIKQLGPQQKYRLGIVSNIKLLEGINWFFRALNSPISYHYM